MNSSLNPALKVHSPTFIQPHVFPAGVRNQVPTPAVSKFMSNDIDVLPITTDNGWSSKRENWILHSSIRETGWQNQDVVLRPFVREDKFLCNLNVLLDVVLELPLGIRELFGSSRHKRPRTNCSRSDIA